MSKKITVKEIELFEDEITESFHSLVNSSTVLQNLHSSVLQVAQGAIDSANTTESYDKKVDSLVKGIQGLVTVVEASLKRIDLATGKYKSDIELINQLKARFIPDEKEEKQQPVLPRDI